MEALLKISLNASQWVQLSDYIFVVLPSCLLQCSKPRADLCTSHHSIGVTGFEVSESGECGMASTKHGSSQRDTRAFLARIVAQSLDHMLKDLSRIRFAFEAKGSARFEDFSATFRELKASLLFQGHVSEANAKIFIEDVYEVLLLEFEDTQVIFAKIFIIYMLYAAYYCQTCRPRVPIRLRREDDMRLQEFMETCRKDNHSDIIYAFRRLQSDCAFHYVHTLRSYGFKSHVIDPEQLTHRKMRLNNRIASHRYVLNNTDLFRRLSFVHEKYCELKSALNLKAEEEALDRENPFTDMHKSVIKAGKTVQDDEQDGEIEADAEGLSDDAGDEDVDEMGPEEEIELDERDFAGGTESVS